MGSSDSWVEFPVISFSFLDAIDSFSFPVGTLVVGADLDAPTTARDKL